MEKIKITREQAKELLRRDTRACLDYYCVESIIGDNPWSETILAFQDNIRTELAHMALRFYLILGEADTRAILAEETANKRAYLLEIKEDFSEAESKCNKLDADFDFMIDDLQEDWLTDKMNFFKFQESRNIFQEKNMFELID